MKKIFSFLLLGLVLSIGNAWGQSDKTNVNNVTTSFSATGSVTSNFTQSGDFTQAKWNLAVTWKSEASWQALNATKGSQVGSGSKPATQIVLTASDVPGTITSIVVNSSVASGGSTTLGVSVGGTTFKCNGNNTATLATSATDFTFTGSGSGDIVLTWNQATTSKAIYIKSVTVTYTPSSTPIAVTGVSLEKSETSLYVGETEMLLYSIIPSSATNPNVSWESDNEAVATVSSDGTVTAVAVGVAHITITTEDGNYTDVCTVAVSPVPLVSATIDLSTNDWGISESPTKTVASTNFTSGIYTITLEGSTGNGYYFDTNNVMLGKSGATLTLPAFPFNVSLIKIYGVDNASGSVSFNIFVGDEAVSTEAISSKLDHDFAIPENKQAAGTIYVIKVTNANNMRISKIEVFGYITLGASGYSTYATNFKYKVSGATVYKATVNGAKTAVTLTEVTDAVIPANEGVILKGEEGEKVAIAESSSAASDFTGNELVGVLTPTLAQANWYVLATNLDGDGLTKFHNCYAGIEIPANKAYMVIGEATAPSIRIIEAGNEATDIQNVEGAEKAVKFMENGKLYIQKNGVVYDAMGKTVR